MTGTYLDIPSHDGQSFKAYHATPSNPNGGCVVVIQEIFGVNYFIREVCDTYAQAGFHAVAPDLFWRMEPGVNITDRSEAEWQKAFGFYQKFDFENGLLDIKQTVAVARTLTGVKKVGVSGYCLGGLVTYLAACNSYGDAFSAYYGGGIHTKLDLAGGLKNPAILHFAEEDGYLDKDAQAQVKAAIGNKPNVTLYFYPDADHAFCRTHSKAYNAAAAEPANARTLAFFKDQLAGFPEADLPHHHPKD